MKINHTELCNGCHACYNVCPVHCIAMEPDTEGFLYPKVDVGKCIDCGLCQKVCPVNHEAPVREMPIAYAAANRNLQERLESSSGGIFVLLAQQIISDNGVVFGAAMSKDCYRVRHIAVESNENLKQLMGSKYVQSEIGDAFSNAKKCLDAGKKVLFSGTPCQIAGLYAYLRRPYDGLYTMDFVCHGVPSPTVWKAYVQAYEKKTNNKAVSVSFRNKKYGWMNYSMMVKYADGCVHHRGKSEDTYLRGFAGHNLFLRPSCYSCHFKQIWRKSDITVGDFWGVDSVRPEMNDGLGTTLLLLQSPKGMELFVKIQDSIRYKETDTLAAIKHNPAIIKSSQMNDDRDVFFSSLGKIPVLTLLERYVKITPIQIFKNRIKKPWLVARTHIWINRFKKKK